MIRRVLPALALVALVSAGSGSGGDSANDFLNKCIRYNEHLTEAKQVDCAQAHVGKVVKVVDSGKECPAPATSQFGMGDKKLCIDGGQ